MRRSDARALGGDRYALRRTRHRLDLRLDRARLAVELDAQEPPGAARGDGPRARAEPLDHAVRRITRLQEALGRLAPDVIGRELELFDAQRARPDRQRRPDDQGGKVVVGSVRQPDDRAQEIPGGARRAELGDEALESRAAEEL